MYYLIYISTAVRPMGQEGLIELLTKSRDNNLRNEITGLLLYASGTFIQVLEGSQKKVLETFHKITEDDRHKNVIMLVSEPQEKRVFQDWLMGFSALATGKLKELRGYIDPNNEMFNGNSSAPAISILKAFVDSNKITNSL